MRNTGEGEGRKGRREKEREKATAFGDQSVDLPHMSDWREEERRGNALQRRVSIYYSNPETDRIE